MGVDAAAIFMMWVIYDRPRDMPEHVVGRRHDMVAGESMPTHHVVTGDSIDAVRRQLPPGLIRLMRHPGDDPHIVEVWL